MKKLLIIAFLILVPFPVWSSSPEVKPDRIVTLIFSSNVYGKSSPAGEGAGSLAVWPGGYFLEKAREKNKNIILVDSGDLFFPPGSTPHSLSGKEREIFDPKIDLYIKAYNEMKYDGFTPGDTDLSLGVQELLKRSRQAQFPFLLANLIERQSKKPVFAPYRIKDAGGMKVGIFGLISNNFHLRQSTGDREKYYLAEPKEIAGKIVSQLKAKGCNIIICLAHMEENEQKNLAQALKGVHFILSGHVRTLKPETQEVNNVEILKAGTRGEYLGQVEFLYG